jgi:hypothetical protein
MLDRSGFLIEYLQAVTSVFSQFIVVMNGSSGTFLECLKTS